MNRMTDQAEQAARFEISHRFAAPRARAWEAWTTPELLAKWFGPRGSTTRILEYDLRPGGAWRSNIVAPNGAMLSKFVFREITPPSRLVWEHSFADEAGNIIKAPFFEHWPLRLLTVVTFVEDGDGTQVTLVWTPIDETAEERRTFLEHFQSMRGGWNGSFAQLDEVLAGAR